MLTLVWPYQVNYHNIWLPFSATGHTLCWKHSTCYHHYHIRLLWQDDNLFKMIHLLFVCCLFFYSSQLSGLLVQRTRADLEGALAPSIFCRDRASDSNNYLRQKECTKSWELTLKNNFFLRFWGGISPPQTPPVPTDTEGLSGLEKVNLGAPLLKNPESAPEGEGEEGAKVYVMKNLEWIQENRFKWLLVNDIFNSHAMKWRNVGVYNMLMVMSPNEN